MLSTASPSTILTYYYARDSPAFDNSCCQAQNRQMRCNKSECLYDSPYHFNHDQDRS